MTARHRHSSNKPAYPVRAVRNVVCAARLFPGDLIGDVAGPLWFNRVRQNPVGEARTINQSVLQIGLAAAFIPPAF